MSEVSILEFLESEGVFIDVRSPIEFEHARIPGAINLPLFSNEERAIIGTLYKKMGHEIAFKKGLEFVNPKLEDFVHQAKKILSNQTAKIYCARGGMRSSSMEWLFNQFGIQTIRLKNGYKSFRQFVLNFNFDASKLYAITGLPGSGKTTILKKLQLENKQTIDLEKIACHRGSHFGAIPGLSQISNAQFENEIIFKWLSFDLSKPIYIEDESLTIGKCKIPELLFKKMKNSPLLLIEKSFEERVDQIMKDYSFIEKNHLIQSTKRISKQLGSQKTLEIIRLIEIGSLKNAIEMILKYYDSTYLYSIQLRNQAIIKWEEVL